MAEHLQIENMEPDATKRDVLRNIQNTFDAAANDGAREALFRGLPVPEPHRAEYELLLDPPPPPVEDGNQIVPDPNANAAPANNQIGDQVVPANNGNGGLVAQQNVVDGFAVNNAQLVQQNLGGVQPGAPGAQQNPLNPVGGPVIQQNLGALQFGNGNGVALGVNANGVRPNMGNVNGGAGQQILSS